MPHHASPHQTGPVPDGFFSNKDFDFAIRGVLGQARYGAADIGEVLAAVGQVGSKDHDAWYQAWHDLGVTTSVTADAAAAAGHRASAAAAYLRAATYFGAAVNAIAALANSDQLVPTFRQHRAAWNSFVDSTSTEVARVEIPYEGTTLPGYFFSPATDGAPRATLIMVNGSDGAISGLWAGGAAGAIERGYNVLLFDGPGQQSMLFEQNTAFRPDWEAVITPVVDFLLGRADVDADKLAIYGVSQGGYWVPRALASEHRITAAIADPGVVDVAESWTAQIPAHLIALLADGAAGAKKFDRDLALGMKFSPETERTWNFRARPYEKSGYAATVIAVQQYTLTDAAASITTPLLITSPEGEQFWPGQSDRLAALVPGHATVVNFTAAEGANLHCQPLGRALTDQRMFDWLDDQLADPPADHPE